MAVYIVREGGVIRWPDHTVRAVSGDLFEGYDSIEPEAARVRAEQILAQGRTAIEIAPESATGGVKTKLHPLVEEELRALGWAPKKKAAKKKKATKKTEEA